MNKPDLDLKTLLQKTGKGDREAFLLVYERSAAKLFGVILRILKQRAVSEDILQEVYLKIWNNASGFDAEKASPMTWMSVIARNRAIDEIRRKRPVVVKEAEEINNIEDTGPSPFKQLEASEDLLKLENCLQELGEKRSQLIRLAYLDGYSRKELANYFDTPVGTVKTWIHRSLKQLKECLTS